METLEITTTEKLNRAMRDTNQTSVVRRMVEAGLEITEVQYSRKKNGHSEFTKEEKKCIEKILKQKIF